MNGSFDAETLQLLDEIDEIHIETRRDALVPAQCTIIWGVTVDGAVFVRSVRSERGRWYREASANPSAALHVDNRRIPVRAVAVSGDPTVGAVSAAYRRKYERRAPGPTRAMLRPATLPTTLRLEPA